LIRARRFVMARSSPRVDPEHLRHEQRFAHHQAIHTRSAALGRPRLVINDEPGSGLDLSNRATVLELFVEIQERAGVAYMFGHDREVTPSRTPDVRTG
jgi:ABC-type microcin C transport system duplicated ATPase subunit YejF